MMINFKSNKNKGLQFKFDRDPGTIKFMTKGHQQ